MNYLKKILSTNQLMTSFPVCDAFSGRKCISAILNPSNDANRSEIVDDTEENYPNIYSAALIGKSMFAFNCK